MKKNIIWAIVFLVLFPLLALRIWLLLTAPPPYLNISKEQYDKALAKWQSYEIEEYEITSHLFSMHGQSVTLRVSDSGNKIAIIEPHPLGEPSPDFLKSMTVNGMFAEVEDLINQEPKTHSLATFTVGSYQMYYQAVFDNTFGYPISVEGHPTPKNAVFDADWWKGIDCITIISQKKGAPQHPPIPPCATPIPTSTPPPPSVNITRDALNRAQAQWLSQNVTEYEEVVDVLRAGPLYGTWTLRVNGSIEEVISYSRSGRMFVPTISSDDLHSLSIEGQFEYIDQLLTDDEPAHRQRVNGVDYAITFDSLLGYPSVVEEKQKPGGLASTLGQIKIKGLTVLKKGSP